MREPEKIAREPSEAGGREDQGRQQGWEGAVLCWRALTCQARESVLDLALEEGSH